jgi:hypothetical protein
MEETNRQTKLRKKDNKEYFFAEEDDILAQQSIDGAFSTGDKKQ